MKYLNKFKHIWRLNVYCLVTARYTYYYPLGKSNEFHSPEKQAIMILLRKWWGQQKESEINQNTKSSCLSFKKGFTLELVEDVSWDHMNYKKNK